MQTDSCSVLLMVADNFIIKVRIYVSLHQNSALSPQLFINLNCSAIDVDVLNKMAIKSLLLEILILYIYTSKTKIENNPIEDVEICDKKLKIKMHTSVIFIRAILNCMAQKVGDSRKKMINCC